MRTYKMFLLATVLPFVAGCARFEENGGDVSGYSVEIVAGFEADASRTVLSGSAVRWSVGDVIRVNGTASQAAKQVGSDNALTAASPSARFTVSALTTNPNGPYYCFYPSGKYVSGSGPVYNFNFPNSQTYLANGFANGANPSVGYRSDAWSNTQVVFRNLCGIVRIGLTGDLTSSITTVRLQLASGDTHKLAGSSCVATINPADELNPTFATGGTTYDYIDVTSSAFTLSGTARYIYFVVPPGTYNQKWQIRLFNGSTFIRSVTASGALTVTRGKITELGTVNFPQLEFAASNIHYDGSKLTFHSMAQVASLADNSSHPKYYQGVYFKFGSLVAIGGNLDEDETNYTYDTYVYYPTDLTSSATTGWTESTFYSSPFWIGSGYDAWRNVPAYTTAFSVGTPGTTSVLFPLTDFSAYTGDICKFLSVKGCGPDGNIWRMPTPLELLGSMSTAITFSDYFTTHNGTINPSWSDIESSMTLRTGKNAITNGIIRSNITPNAFFPASGNLGYTHFNIVLSNIGSFGHYWSGGGYNTGPSITNFMQNHIQRDDLIGFNLQHYGCYPVRCVKAN